MKFYSDILAKAGLIVDGTTQLNTIANASIDTDRFIVSDSGVIKYRTGTQLASDIDAMTKTVYDSDNDGTVDDSEKITVTARNSTGSTIYKGTIVYFSGSTGNRPNMLKAQSHTEATSSKTFGVVVDDVADNSDGQVAAMGTLHDLDTRSSAPNPFTSDTLVDGDVLWLSPTTAGYVTRTKPTSPNHAVFIGYVARTSPTNGRIVYKIQNGLELDELHNVSASTPSNNDGIFYNSTTGLWEAKAITAISGITGSGTTNYLPKWTSASALGNSLVYDDGTSIGINNASPSSTYKLDVSGSVQIVGKVYANQNTQASNPFIFDMNTRYGSGTDGFLIRGYYSDAGTGPYHNPLTVLSPSMNTGERTYINVGRANSTNNRGQIGFWYNGAGSANNHITFGFWGVENIFTIKAGGNVQVGTSGVDAGYKLDINGDIRVQTIANATTDTDRFLVSDSGVLKYRTGSELLSDIGAQPALTNPVTGTGTTNYLPKWTGTTALGNSLVYDDGTNVGIGTASPAYKLDVNGVIKSATGLYVGPVNHAAASINVSSFTTKSNFANSVMTLSSTETGSGGIYPTQVIFAQEGATTGWSIQSVNQGVAYTPLILNPNGSNVLIGTKTDAGYKLDVAGTFRTATNSLQPLVSATTYEALYLKQGTPSLTNYSIANNATDLLINTSTSGNIEFRAANSMKWAIRSGTLNNNLSNVDSRVPLWITTSAANAWGMIINASASQTNNLLELRNSSNSTLSTFFSDGSLGVGTGTNAGYKLDVNGTARISTNSNAPQMYVTSTGATTRLGINHSSNTGVGLYSLYYNTTGSSNTAIGQQSLFVNTSCTNNVAVGQAALICNTTASNNVAVGYGALYYTIL